MTITDICELIEGNILRDSETSITTAAGLEFARNTDVTFVEKSDTEIKSDAGCLLAPSDFQFESASEFSGAVIAVKNPKLAFARVAAVLYPQKKREPEIHVSSIVAGSASIGADVFIGAFVCVGENSRIGDGSQVRAGAKIGDDVTIGQNCTIHSNVFIEDGVVVGDNVILHAGVVLGADGFGYVRDGGRGYVKFPQIGAVVIENDVEIGANTCIDRGSLGETRIGEGTKIDNLVQIAHNVQIGKRVVIASQTGISGSTVIEDDCVIGGQVGFGDHAKVLSGAIIGSKAGILPGKIVRPGVWWGIPVQPLDEYKRQNAMVKGLPRLREEVKDLKRRLDESEESLETLERLLQMVNERTRPV